ncbi:hypothetical protein [Paenibacillus spongiae]|uniref:Protein-export membrane protein SecG n=1 Tax=Paenibacillus spongiae TaxID=2909671 RepID=A0ABY5S9A8_9BACL|nr:hypothetical protein [Paenibacillus spongiae]UVI30098.1 hypothetical protein L1F29_32785 [Paenibacillus spongiae]
MNILIVLVIVFMVLALVTTFLVGFSKENKEGSPTYEQKTGAKWARLSSFYVIATIVCLAIFFMILMNG